VGINGNSSIFSDHSEDPEWQTDQRKAEFWEYEVTTGAIGEHLAGTRAKKGVFTPTQATTGDVLVMIYQNDSLYFKLNQHSLGKAFEEVPKCSKIDTGDKPVAYIRCLSQGTKVEILNYFDVDESPADLKFGFELHSEMMEDQIKERLKERAGIGRNQDLRIQFADFKAPEDKTSYFVIKCFPHKRDYGQTFAVGLAKMAKSAHFWLNFFNQGFYSRTIWSPPQMFDYRPQFEVVFVIDRRNGVCMQWIRETQIVFIFRDEKMVTGDVQPCFVARKEKTHVRLKVENEDEEGKAED
jgi:hypothetical protein